MSPDELLREFARECRRERIALRVWYGPTACFGGRMTVCYQGSLGSCEDAERRVIPEFSRRHPEELFCYVSPAPASATSTDDLAPETPWGGR